MAGGGVTKGPASDLGFLAGVAALFGGVKKVTTTPGLWPYAVVPAIAALVVALVLAFAGYKGLHAVFPSLFADAGSTLAGYGVVLVRMVVYALLAVVSLLLGMALAQPLSGPALDRIARETRGDLVRRAGDIVTEPPPSSFVDATFRSLRVTLVTLGVGAPILIALTVIDLLFPPAAIVTWPCKLMVTGLLATWDLVDYPMSLEQRGVRERTAWLRANPRYALGFGVTAALLSAVPFLGLLLLPCGVAGATLLVHRAQNRRA